MAWCPPCAACIDMSDWQSFCHSLYTAIYTAGNQEDTRQLKGKAALADNLGISFDVNRNTTSHLTDWMLLTTHTWIILLAIAYYPTTQPMTPWQMIWAGSAVYIQHGMPGMADSSCYIVKKVQLTHCKRGPQSCEKCRAVAADKYCLLDICPDDPQIARPMVMVETNGAPIWREYDIEKIFDSRQDALEYAKIRKIRFLEEE